MQSAGESWTHAVIPFHLLHSPEVLMYNMGNSELFLAKHPGNGHRKGLPKSKQTFLEKDEEMNSVRWRLFTQKTGLELSIGGCDQLTSNVGIPRICVYILHLISSKWSLY